MEKLKSQKAKFKTSTLNYKMSFKVFIFDLQF